MSLFRSGVRRCKRCEYELEGGEDICPRCQFSPRAKGLRIALGLLMAVVVSMTVVMFVPAIGSFLIRVAALSFLLSIATIFVSFFATPYRFGSLFLRL